MKKKYWIQSYIGGTFGWENECPCEDTDTAKDRHDLLALYDFEMPQYFHRLVCINNDESKKVIAA